MSAQTRLRIFLFGKPSIQLDGKELSQSISLKVQELLYYILMYRDRPHFREVLSTLLWGESPTPKSKKYLRQTLWQLQKTLVLSEPTGHPNLLEIDLEWIRVNQDANYWLDVSQFEMTSQASNRIKAKDLSPQDVDKLQIAVNLYSGDLLEGWYQDWCIYQRERFQNIYFEMLEKLMAYCDAHRLYEEGQVYGSRILSIDPIRERTLRRMMRLYYGSGNRTEALRLFKRFEAALQSELGVEPSRPTLLLVEQIRQDRLNLSPVEQDAPNPARPAPHPRTKPQHLLERLAYLNHFFVLLSNVQNWVREDIEAIERELKSGSDPSQEYQSS
jgi:DNA-binding SARP family transcriptional activator